MVWPNPHDIMWALHFSSPSLRRLEIILQIGKNAMEECENNPDKVVEKLGFYRHVVDRVLLDKSMGRGLGMDAEGLIPFAKAIKKKYPHIGLVAAGGLGPGTVDLIKPLLKEFPDISMDAQGKLRPSGNALDPIDWDMAGKYLIEALEAVTKK
jgi:hypothetical protein